jgi:N-acetylglucosaminyldiphosphoundecaprenol N-acetyl-beta-D-mannosaminyltransferase
VKAAKMLDIDIPERIPGIDIAQQLLQFGNDTKKTIFLFGAKQEVLDALKQEIGKEYPDINILGMCNGYVEDKNKVFETIEELEPDIILVALGMPVQEKLIYESLDKFNKGIFVGVGGSFDVLSGTKKRAPEFFIKHNLEWLYRIAKEPSRIRRFYDNNIKFLFKINKEKK